MAGRSGGFRTIVLNGDKLALAYWSFAVPRLEVQSRVDI